MGRQQPSQQRNGHAPQVNGDTSLTIPSSALTPYHAAYYAHELTRRSASDNIAKIGSSLFNATMDLRLWQLTEHELAGLATFCKRDWSFELYPLDETWPQVPTGQYQFITVRKPDGHHIYRLGHPLAQEVIARAQKRKLRTAHVRFDYSSHPGKVGILDQMIGKSGWLRLARMSVQSLEEEDRLLFAVCDEQGKPLDPDIGEKLFQVGGEVIALVQPDGRDILQLEAQLVDLEERVKQEIAERNKDFFERELNKLDRWADDCKTSLDLQLRDLKAEIKRLDREARLAGTLEEKLALQRQKKEVEKQRKEKQRELYEAEDKIDEQKDKLLDEVEKRLEQKIEVRELFTIHWEIV